MHSIPAQDALRVKGLAALKSQKTLVFVSVAGPSSGNIMYNSPGHNPWRGGAQHTPALGSVRTC